MFCWVCYIVFACHTQHKIPLWMRTDSFVLSLNVWTLFYRNWNLSKMCQYFGGAQHAEYSIRSASWRFGRLLCIKFQMMFWFDQGDIKANGSACFENNRFFYCSGSSRFDNCYSHTYAHCSIVRKLEVVSNHSVAPLNGAVTINTKVTASISSIPRFER